MIKEFILSLSFILKDQMENNTTHKHCLNCQTELIGEYCHKCGQQATKTKPTIKGFILEYLGIAFIWDTLFFKTIWDVIRKPGHVTNEYMSGKVLKYMHPLKLNMFLLFVFITLFVLFHKDPGSGLKSLTRDEMNYPVLQLGILADDTVYAERLKSSPLDTVHLYAPLLLAEAYPEIVTDIDGVRLKIGKDSLVVWRAALPQILIEDNVITQDAEGNYYFSSDDKSGNNSLKLVENIWTKMVQIATRYFPMIILLTVPFLSFLLRILQRRKQHSRFKHFIFSLHYTAVLEMIIIVLFLLHLTLSPPVWIMQWILISGACIYMTLAIKRVYETKRWYIATSLSILTNIGYAAILVSIFTITCFIAAIIAIIKM